MYELKPEDYKEFIIDYYNTYGDEGSEHMSLGKMFCLCFKVDNKKLYKEKDHNKAKELILNKYLIN